ncbi:MAG: hypothetical protein QME42_08375, partial [bacterium]|nr:hypothetical protein [bacterium]
YQRFCTENPFIPENSFCNGSSPQTTSTILLQPMILQEVINVRMIFYSDYDDIFLSDKELHNLYFII